MSKSYVINFHNPLHMATVFLRKGRLNMDKNKRRGKNHVNFIRPEIRELFINKWSNNQELKGDAKITSILFETEDKFLVQVIISEDKYFNGIYLIKEFKFGIKNNEYAIEIIDLEDIYISTSGIASINMMFKSVVEEFKVILPSEFKVHLDDPLPQVAKYPKLILD